ncbi:MAG TPA: hypothetical protein VIK10_11620, partial [Prolixibacteraceae bacterium]
HLSDNASKLSRLKIEPEILGNPLDIFRLSSCSKSNHFPNLLVVDKQLYLYSKLTPYGVTILSHTEQSTKYMPQIHYGNRK